MKPRLLLAEDDPSVQRVAVRMVERLGWESVVTASGLEAVESTIATRFDVVLLDLGLHDIGGLEATARIRAREVGHRTPLIAITGDSAASARDRCLAAGMDDYLAKPLSISSLRNALSRWGRTTDRARTPSGERRAVVLEPPTLSDQTLLEAAGGDAGFMRDVARLFLGDCETRVVELSRAVAAFDGAERIRLAHKLKGAAAMVGALRLAGLAERLETMPTTDAVEDVARALTSELEVLRRRLLAL